MLLQQLRDFEWLNEPQAVFFLDSGMKVVANPETNFWQNKKISLSRDSGHFFHTPKQGDFSLTVNWTLIARPTKAQCGIMLRIDKENWAKCYSMWDDDGKNKVCLSVTNLGLSDISEIQLDYEDTNIWLRAARKSDVFEFSYSKDGDNYVPLRKFPFIKDTEKINAGAYICSPNKTEFEAVLSYIEFA
ncbi:MAG: DUF1349 domain-containing protein [Lactobacillaceae bacterium]|jgi:regulation of enolase protein 1 (concanavalin A-like superfamily)|nr:DUF1349 domain-containing protein [Lactobacillaceae bacterium]